MRPKLKRTITRFILSSQTGRRKRPGLLRRKDRRGDSGGGNDRNEDDLKSPMADVRKKSI